MLRPFHLMIVVSDIYILVLSNRLCTSERGFLRLGSKQGLLLRFLFPVGYDRKF